ncbi:MAG TPA: DUF6230 family protein, partial [Ktedonobacterales bacterium]|nr:DUF6230 family protein [Ktedonobacterales bacterium]
LITGAVGIVLALISLIVAAGGFGIGIFLGLACGALGIAWLSDNEQGHRTSRKTFGITYGLSLVAMIGLFALIANGIVAMAAAIPVPVTVTASNIAGTNMQVVPGVSHADNQSPVGEIQMNADISNLVISKTFNTPLGNISLKMASGSSSPAKLNGLTIDASALAADQADLGGLTINTGNSAGFSLNSSTANLTNVNITSPYLVVNSITLPNLSISFSIGH